MRGWASRRRAAPGRSPWKTAGQLRPAEIRRLWADFNRLRRALFDEGGAVIESSREAAGRHGALDARTVVQPDGDVLWFVDEEVAGDESVLRAHVGAVAEWYDEGIRTMAALGAQLKVLRAVASGLGVGLFAVLSPADLWSLWTPAVALLAQPAVQEATGRLVRKGMAAVLS